MPSVFVKSFTHLKDRPHADKALPLLQRVASLVKPIMRKHGWVLPVLSEFFPESPNLLGMNVNAGQKILVRLRPAHSPDTFYDEEDILHTMLHELTHNVHGPHDDKFYKLLSELEEEYEALRRSGYSGEGFHSNGRRLGANVSHNLPPHIARQKAIDAAEKRRQIIVVLSGGGKLGGTVRSNKSPRELAAGAAERRIRDEKACGLGAQAQAEADKAAKESVQDDVIDLTLDDDDNDGTNDSSPEPEIIIIDDAPSPISTPGSSTPLSRLRAESGYSSSTSIGSRTPASWSGLRPGSGYASSSSSLSTLSGTSTTTAAPHPVRPTVRRVERGAGPGTPTLPKPRSRSRSRPPAHALAHTHGHGSPATPPPTRTNSVAVPHKRHSAGEAALAAAAVVPPEREWACPRCTLINDALALQCAACLLLRPGLHAGESAGKGVGVGPGAGAEGWTCGVCGEGGMPHDFWTCGFCGSVKARS
ncbi:WLM domain-containing protein [Trametes maxima]|nr:WLM domain-containing protein [Trametes maxima]